MTTILSKGYSNTTEPRVRYRRTETDRPDDRTFARHYVTQRVTEEQEATMVATYAFALAILGITPLIAFLIIYYFTTSFPIGFSS